MSLYLPHLSKTYKNFSPHPSRSILKGSGEILRHMISSAWCVTYLNIILFILHVSSYGIDMGEMVGIPGSECVHATDVDVDCEVVLLIRQGASPGRVSV